MKYNIVSLDGDGKQGHYLWQATFDAWWLEENLWSPRNCWQHWAHHL